MKKPNFRNVMNHVGGFVVRFRVPIIIVIALLFAFSVYGITLTKINSDVMSYLPKGTDTYDGSEFLSENFGIESNAVYAIKGDSITREALADAVDSALEDEHIIDIMWLGSMDRLTSSLSLPVSDPFTLLVGGKETESQLQELFYKDGNYMLIVMMNVGASTNEAGESLCALNAALGDAEYVAGGTAPVSRKVYDDAINELPIYLSIAVVLVLIILFLVSANYLEPLVFMLTMGVSIVINMGTNFFFPEVSIITFCAASILQLALAMDYSIFLTQIYSEERNKGLPVQGAMIHAIGTTLNTVFASALTTMGGFAAFFVMSFTLGADLGGVLIKGIFLAMLTVIILQPCLLILLTKPMSKTGHKRIVDIKFKRVARFSVKHRTIIVILFALILAPAFIGQYHLPLSYLNFMPKAEGDPTLVSYVSDISNQIFLAAPVDQENPRKNIEFVQEIEQVKGVTAVAGYYAFLPAEGVSEEGKLISVFGETQMDVGEIGREGGYITESGYTLYMISLSHEKGVESLEATAVLDEVKSIAARTFTEKCYTTGVVQAVTEFREITPRDFRWITIISVAVIFVVLLLSFRNLVYPFLLVLLIELGTWINFSISTIFRQSLNFLAYIVVGAIQLGATVDYAILVTHRYRALLKEEKDPLTAAYESGTSCTMSILTSASILVAACASVTAVSSNAVIREVTMMCMRGAVISTLLVLFVLPSLLACTSRLGQKAAEAGGFTNLSKNFLSEANRQIHEFTLVKKAKRRVRREHLLQEGERLEDLEARGLVIIQPQKGYRFNSDSVILANIAEADAGEKGYDLGCGSGVMGLLVAAKRETKVIGIEIQPRFASMAKRSVLANDYADKVEILEGDLRSVESILPAGEGDFFLLNPPYYKEGDGEISHDEGQAIARHEITLTIKEALRAAAYLLKEGGRGYLVFPKYREKELTQTLQETGFTPVEKIYLTSSEEKAPEHFILKVMKGEAPLPCTERVLVTKDREGNMSKEVAALYRS